ncbi:hypothetical protein [Sulfuracidifex tepidarius]|uniref:hypothetical protein n=1 Tax=Sulfuracidifex tepidarius TaxID=1294262 RepID=UPI00210C3724|nr:hypothetical protein [Sulfuracidifex tepidarius]
MPTSTQATMTQGEYMTCYNQFNGTYFPYKVMVTYFPGNYSGGMGFPSKWTVTNDGQEHNAVVPTTSTALMQGVSWELPLNNYVGGVAIPLTTPDTRLPWAQQLGVKGALVMQTQMAGEPLGVTLADNLLFATEDSMMGSISAINSHGANSVDCDGSCWTSHEQRNSLQGTCHSVCRRSMFHLLSVRALRDPPLQRDNEG